MDAREGAPVDVDAYLEGFEFGLAAIRGRLERMEDPTKQEMLHTLEEYRALAQRMRRRRSDAVRPTRIRR